MKLTRAALLVFIVVMVGFVLDTVSNAQPVDDNCATCHLALGIANLTKPAEDYKSDIHAVKGFGCASCHGGDPSIMGLEGMDRKKGYIGKPARGQVVEVCGKCHSDAAFMRQYNPSLRVDQVVARSEGSKSCDLQQLSQTSFDPAGQRCALVGPPATRRRYLRRLSRQ